MIDVTVTRVRRRFHHEDGEIASDHRPTNREMNVILRASDPAERVTTILEVCERVYEAGMREGKGYAAEPDLTLRRLVVGLQHSVSHVHHHLRHTADWIDCLAHEAPVEAEDELPSGRGHPTILGRQLARNDWRACQKDPCRGLAAILTDTRLWPLLEERVPHTHG